MTTLTTALHEIVRHARCMAVGAFENTINAASDDLATGDSTTDLPTDAILDGIRWGQRAAVSVEMGGSTFLRLIEPGGVRITHEWHDTPQSAVGRATIMQSVMSAMGDEAPSEAVNGVWNEASQQTADRCIQIIIDAADRYKAESKAYDNAGLSGPSEIQGYISSAIGLMAVEIKDELVSKETANG